MRARVSRAHARNATIGHSSAHPAAPRVRPTTPILDVAAQRMFNLEEFR